MDSKLEIQWPEKLAIYRDNIEATIKPFVAIEARVSSNLPLWQSKFAGVPYLPKDIDYPTDSEGRAMFLLAQINFNDVPNLESFPEEGILQFYVCNDFWDNDEFKVMYFPKVVEEEDYLVKDFSFLPQANNLPVTQECSLDFYLRYAPITICDYQFAPTVLNLPPQQWHELFNSHPDIYNEYLDFHMKNFSTAHQIGGYPSFIQNDPRLFDRYRDSDYRLLFLMGSDEDLGIVWGDGGIANFFITEQDLLEKDFSKVFFYWDCC